MTAPPPFKLCGLAREHANVQWTGTGSPEDPDTCVNLAGGKGGIPDHWVKTDSLSNHDVGGTPDGLQTVTIEPNCTANEYHNPPKGWKNTVYPRHFGKQYPDRTYML